MNNSNILCETCANREMAYINKGASAAFVPVCLFNKVTFPTARKCDCYEQQDPFSSISRTDY